MAEVYVLNDRERSYIDSFHSKLVYHQNAALQASGSDVGYHCFQVDCARTNIQRIREGRLEELLDE